MSTESRGYRRLGRAIDYSDGSSFEPLRVAAGSFRRRCRVRRRPGPGGIAGRSAARPALDRAPTQRPVVEPAADSTAAHSGPDQGLASDEFEGRAPGTKGEELTVQYLESEFKSLGLKPGNTDGTYIQKVPLVGITATETRPLTIARTATTRSAQVARRDRGLDQARRRPGAIADSDSSSPATASRRRSSTGTTSRTSTSKARRSSCS